MGMEFEQDLRYTSDEMLRALERLRELEARKRKVKPGTERFRKLAQEVEDLAGTVFSHTSEQKDLATKSVELVESQVIEPRPIDEMPPVRELHIILNDWRDAERRLSAAAPGTEDAADVQAEIERLRLEYRRAAEQAWEDEHAR
jgi:hypothetical protein